ncbi:hypothetical protein D3C87_1380470 [compost metagenome]
MVGRQESPVRQHLHHQPLFQGSARREIRQATNAEVLQYRAKPHACVIGGIAPAHTDRDRLAAFLEFPPRIARGFPQVNATVVEQVMGMGRRSMFGQILRGRAEQMIDRQ